MSRAGRIASVVVASLLLASGASCRTALADDAPPPGGSTKMQCIAADTDGQRLRVEQQLHAAREHFVACIAVSCPEIVREDCLERIEEIARVQPTVVFDATNGSDRLLRAVKVFMDGRQIADRLDGRALAIDPGEHVFVFQALGRARATLLLTLEEGSNERRAVVLRADSVAAVADHSPDGGEANAPHRRDPQPPSVTPASPAPVFAAPSPTETPPLVAKPVEAAPPVEAVRPSPASGPAGFFANFNTDYRKGAGIAGVVAVTGVVAGTVFGLLTFSNWGAAVKDLPYPGSRSQSERSAALTDGAVSTTAFVVSGIALLTGLALWVGDPAFKDSAGSPRHATTRIVPVAGPGGAELLLLHGF